MGFEPSGRSARPPFFKTDQFDRSGTPPRRIVTEAKTRRLVGSSAEEADLVGRALVLDSPADSPDEW